MPRFLLHFLIWNLTTLTLVGVWDIPTASSMLRTSTRKLGKGASPQPPPVMTTGPFGLPADMRKVNAQGRFSDAASGAYVDGVISKGKFEGEVGLRQTQLTGQGKFKKKGKVQGRFTAKRNMNADEITNALLQLLQHGQVPRIKGDQVRRHLKLHADNLSNHLQRGQQITLNGRTPGVHGGLSSVHGRLKLRRVDSRGKPREEVLSYGRDLAFPQLKTTTYLPTAEEGVLLVKRSRTTLEMVTLANAFRAVIPFTKPRLSIQTITEYGIKHKNRKKISWTKEKSSTLKSYLE